MPAPPPKLGGMNEGLRSSALSRRFCLALLPALLLLACAEPASGGGPEASAAASAVTSTPTSSSAASGDHASHTDHSGNSHGASTTMTNESEASEASAAATATLPLQVVSAGVTAVPPSLTDTVAYVTLRNTGSEDVVLTGATTPAAAHVMLMQTVATNSGGASMSGMVEVPSLTVPAGGQLQMGSAGDHLMLMGLNEPLNEGASIPLTLQAADGRTLEVNAEVARP